MPCATLGARQPLPLPHTPQLTLCSLSLVLLTQQPFELFPLSQPSTGQGSAPSPTWQHSPAPSGKEQAQLILLPLCNLTAGILSQEGGRSGWCFHVCQNEPGAKASGMQEWSWVLGGPVPSFPGSLATFQEIRQLNGKSSLFSLHGALHTWVFQQQIGFQQPCCLHGARMCIPSKAKSQPSSTSGDGHLGWGSPAAPSTPSQKSCPPFSSEELLTGRKKNC